MSFKFSPFPTGYENPFPVVYSSVVDTSRFTLDDKSKRAIQNGVDGSASKGLYDLDGTERDFKTIDGKLPDMMLVALREGKLDRVEIEKVRSALIAENERLSQENQTKAAAKRRQEQFDRQMEVIDQALNLKSDTESDSQNLGNNNS